MEIAPAAPVNIFGMQVNWHTLYTSWIIMGFLGIVGFFASRSLSLKRPSRFQVFIEMFVDAFDTLVRDTLGERGRKYLPFIGTLFLFVWCSNMIGVLPLGLEEPTRDVSTPIALTFITLFVVHVSAIRVKGIKGYLKGYFEPIFLMAPLNVIGEIAKGVSHAFRLFGNIFGGAVIIIVVSELILHIGLPPFLNAFFGIFVGTIQAFVYAMLALAYTAVAIAED